MSKLIYKENYHFSLYFDLNKVDDTLLFQKEENDKKEKNYVFMEKGTVWTRFETISESLIQ